MNKSKTVCGTWYEAMMVRGWGCRLNGTFNSKREAAKAIKESRAKEVENGYKASEYFIVFCNVTRMLDENGDVIMETVTKARV